VQLCVSSLFVFKIVIFWCKVIMNIQRVSLFDQFNFKICPLRRFNKPEIRCYVNQKFNLPAGDVTSSFSFPGCSRVSLTIVPAPRTVCDANRYAISLGMPIRTAPSAIASIITYTCNITGKSILLRFQFTRRYGRISSACCPCACINIFVPSLSRDEMINLALPTRKSNNRNEKSRTTIKCVNVFHCCSVLT
jgi:hypothetical protein